MRQSVVVPYIGTWIETGLMRIELLGGTVVPYIGTWIETSPDILIALSEEGRTLYRYVD